MQKQISKTEFITAVNACKTRKELMEQFGLPIGQVKAFAKACNVEIKRDNKPKFMLIDDTEQTQVIQSEVKRVAESLNA